jgi:amidase
MMAPSTEQAQAFLPGEIFELGGLSSGPLAGLSFAVKDLFDIAGRRTGAGNPTWNATHPPAAKNAAVVDRLLKAGAKLVGKTITDELAYSIVGNNWHLGIPRNGAKPDRMPGGSSSGSASAVSNGLCDFSVGTDSGGSVRVPASYCGLFAMRPTHGKISLDGCVPLTPSYDTCGWFARTAKLLERVGLVLLESSQRSPAPQFKILIAPEIWSSADDDVIDSLGPMMERLEGFTGRAVERSVFADEREWNALDQHSRNLQAFEAWQTFGDWITTTKPAFGPEIEERFRHAATVTSQHAHRARLAREQFTVRISELLTENALICMPTTPTVAPLRSVEADQLQAVRLRTLRFTCIAGIAGVPQLTIPLRTASGIPCGLSLVGRRNSDEALLRFASEVLED